jgi:hypothetical protein
MPMGILFWFLMILWLVGGLYFGQEGNPGNKYWPIGGSLLLFILLGLLGWKLFGPVLQ